MSQETIDANLLRLSPPPSASAMTPCDSENLDPSESTSPVATCCDSTLCDDVSSERDFPSSTDVVLTTCTTVDAANTPPVSTRSPSRDIFSSSSPVYNHHLPHRDSFYQLTVQPTEVVVVRHHPLPLSPSMTPPIVLSPTLSPSAGSTDDESDSESSPVEESSASSVANSPISLASDDETEESEEEVKEETTTQSSPPPLLCRSRPGSLRRGRSSARFTPYIRAHCHQGVLRPINDGGLSDGTSRQRTALVDSLPSCDSTNSRTTTISLESEDKSLASRTTAGNLPEPAHPHQALHIDTHLANSQSAAAQKQSRAAKTALAQRILALIDDDDFDNFLAILRHKKPDLNVFINGQTALHYCLMLGTYSPPLHLRIIFCFQRTSVPFCQLLNASIWNLLWLA